MWVFFLWGVADLLGWGIMFLVFNKLKMKMKKIVSGVLLVVLSFLVVGCEKKESAASRNKTVDLQVWVSRPEADIIRDIGREFSSQKNNKVRLKLVIFEDEAQLQELLVDQMAEAYGPDVVLIDGNWVALNENKVESLEDDEIFSKDAFEQAFVKGAVDTLLSDDKILGVPLGVDTLALFYNEEHLANALSDRNQPGRTWKEIRQDVEKLNRPDNSFERFAISGAALGRLDNITYGIDILENIMFQTGVEFFTEDGMRSRIASSTGVTSEGKRENFGEEAVRFFSSFADERYKNFSWTELLAESQSEEKDYETFVEGKTSLVFGYARDYERIQALVKKRRKGGKRSISTDSVRVAFLPQMDDPEHSHSRDVVSKIPALAVPRTAKYPELAWEFLVFAVQEKSLKSFHDEMKISTPRLSLLSEQEVEPGIGIFVRQAKFAKPNFILIPREEFVLHFEKMVLLINESKLSPIEGLKGLEKVFTDRLEARARKLKEIESKKEKEEEEESD